MTLETLYPDPEWSPDEREREAIDTVRELAPDLSIAVWGGDWCGDCQAVLPALGAALARAGIDRSDIEQFPVEKRPDGTKVGPGVVANGIERIPTVLVEIDGREVARFVESAERSAIVSLADQLRAAARNR